MSRRSYSGSPLDGTVQYITERPELVERGVVEGEIEGAGYVWRDDGLHRVDSGAPLDDHKEFPPGARTGRDQGRRVVQEHPLAVTDDWVDSREGSMTNGELVSSTDGLVGYFRRVQRRVRAPDPVLDRAASLAIKRLRGAENAQGDPIGRHALDCMVWYAAAERLASRATGRRGCSITRSRGAPTAGRGWSSAPRWTVSRACEPRVRTATAPLTTRSVNEFESCTQRRSTRLPADVGFCDEISGVVGVLRYLVKVGPQLIHSSSRWDSAGSWKISY